MTTKVKPKNIIHEIKNKLAVLPTANGFGVFAMVTELDASHIVQTSYHSIEEQDYPTQELAQRVIDDKQVRVSKNLQSLYGSIKEEFRDYSLSENQALEVEKGTFQIATYGCDNSDDEQFPPTWIEEIKSREKWFTLGEAKEALDTGNYTEITNFDFTPVHFEQDEIRVLQNQDGSYMVARPWLMLFDKSYKGAYADLNVWEIVGRSYPTEAKAKQALTNYWKYFK